MLSPRLTPFLRKPTPNKKDHLSTDQLLDILESEDYESLRGVLGVIQKEDLNKGLDNQDNTLLHLVAMDCAKFPTAVLNEIVNHRFIDANVCNKSGTTPLHYLCQKWVFPDMNLPTTLIQKNANVNTPNSLGETPLFKAILNRKVGNLIVNFLLKNNANPNLMTNNGEGILHYVVRERNVDTVEFLLGVCDARVLKTKGTKGKTPSEIAKEDSENATSKFLYETISKVEELDDFLANCGLSSYRTLFITEKFDLDVLVEMTEEQIQAMPFLKMGPKTRLISALTALKKKKNKNVLDSPIKGLRQHDSLLISLKKLSHLEFLNYEHLEFIEKLGEGASGVVWKGRLNQPGEPPIDVAIKAFNPGNEDLKGEFMKEIKVFKSIIHPNVLSLFGICSKPSFLLITEYCTLGSLYHVMNDPDIELGWEHFFKIAIQITEGLHALHSFQPSILHRDLKSLNLLLTGNWTLKVADFGLSLAANSNTEVLSEQRGTPLYMAPELFQRKKYSRKSDIYSFGIVLWELLYRVINQKYLRPLGEYQLEKMLILFHVSVQSLRPTIPPSTPPEIRKIINDCWKTVDTERPECAQLVYLLHLSQTIWSSNKARWQNCIVNTNQYSNSQT
uniref:Protein kinase domain-containing protein n=1 Tax=Arcella intermedia TaxID=1963864 RepID=A0A6B2KZT3_9EUKA